MKHPNCDFHIKSMHEISILISSKVKSGEPCSLIRLGDGEGLLLSISSQSSESDFKYVAEHFGPDSIDLGSLLHLKSRLIQAIKSADIIGVRGDVINVSFEPGNFSLPEEDFLENFRKCFKLREIEKSLGYHGSRRIAFLHKYLSNLNLRDDSQFCSAWFHYEVYRSGAILRLLEQQERIGIISCRAKLPGLLKKLLSVNVRFYEIPDMYRDISKEMRPRNYIEQLENFFTHQHVEYPGMVYLIGGGLYGKLYCEFIRSQGGIALDFGSLFDAWVGIPSRQAVYKTMFNRHVKETDVPSELQLTAENVEYLRKCKV